MSKWDIEYLKLCKKILEEGVEIKGIRSKNRTNGDYLTIGHYHLEFDLDKEFPILTTKHVAFKWAVLEMLWIYKEQSHDVRWLQNRGIDIWDEWKTDENGYYKGRYVGKKFAHTIGPAYGYIVKKYDLLRKRLLEPLKKDLHSRRMIVNLWQDNFVDKANLPSCVWSTEWGVLDGKLNCYVHQRSADVPLGLPFNVTQYAVLVNLIAHVTGLKPGKMSWSINDAHIYLNQIDGIKTQLERINDAYEAPKLWINPEIKDFFEFDSSRELKDIKVLEYKHHPPIKIPKSS